MLSTPSRIRQICLFIPLLGALLALPAAAESSPQTWNCLPEETVGAVRIPDGHDFVEALKRNTKLGASLFNDKNKAVLEEIFETSFGEEWEEFQKQLVEFGLTLDDLKQLLAGESGYAVVVDGKEAEEAFVAGLAWIEPGEELVGRSFEVLAKVIALSEDDEFPIIRVDLELAGQPVMQLKVPLISIEYTEEYDFGGDYENLSEEEQEEAVEKAWEKYQESAVETAKYQTVLIAKLGGRLLLAHAYKADDENADKLSATLARLITSHTTGEGGFVSRLQDEPKVAQTLGLEGVPGLEMLVDVAGLIELLGSSAPAKERAEKAFRMVGTEGIGPLAIRMTLDGTKLNSAFSLAVSSPRTGFMKLLDQEKISAEPPSWVPVSAVSYTQVSFDLGKLYALVKEELLREFPGQAENWLQMADGQVQGFVQASLEELLGSIGHRHTVVSYGIESLDTGDAEDEPTERNAIVWQVKNEAIWGRLLEALKPFAGMTQGAEFIEELGYRGWRMKGDQFEGGLMLGKGNLVFAMGSEVMETTLSSLNNPPVGEKSFRESGIYTTATEMLDLSSVQGVGITDGSRNMKIIFATLGKQLSAAEKAMDDDGEARVIELFRKLMPSKDEAEKMMGIGVSYYDVDEEGIHAYSVTELPAP